MLFHKKDNLKHIYKVEPKVRKATWAQGHRPLLTGDMELLEGCWGGALIALQSLSTPAPFPNKPPTNAMLSAASKLLYLVPNHPLCPQFKLSFRRSLYAEIMKIPLAGDPSLEGLGNECGIN